VAVELRVGVAGMPEGLIEVLMVTAVNRSPFPVTVAEPAFELTSINSSR
jgi:hypothetical protein